MTIELPGYRAVVPNNVYSRDAKIAITDSESININEIIIPRRFIQPCKKDVLNFIVNSAKKTRSEWQRFIKARDFSMLKGIEEIFARFSEQTISGMAEESELVMRELEGHMYVPQEENGKYLFLTYGIIPVQVVEHAQDNGEVFDESWYISNFADKNLLYHSLGERFRLTLLLKDNVLPPKSEMDILVKNKSSVSDILNVSIMHYSPTEVGNIINAIYSGIDSPEKVEELEDLSQVMVEKQAITTLVSLYNTLIFQGSAVMMPLKDITNNSFMQ